MVFSSAAFLFQFLAPFLALYYVTPVRFRNAALTVASYVFYGCWRPDFLLLIVFSSLLDFVLGHRIAAAREGGRPGTRYLVVSLVANLGLLGWFKYANFGVEQFNALLQGMGAEPVAWTKVILPVGISFYTFQTMSYSIDIWRGEVKPARRLVDFMCFVAMFPQLVAGPIVRYRSVEDQLVRREHSWSLVSQGLLLFQLGLIKKLLVADVLKPVADGAFDVAGRSMLEAWVGVFSYSLQIYFDFSGYSDMAIGLGLMLGFRLPINFDGPYRSRSITEFWRRWHITLSTWLRDYLYVGLGGNRRGRWVTYRNLFLVMALGGLWHGDQWTFVLWGVWHGVLLASERLLGVTGDSSRRRPLWCVGTTFLMVLLGWVLFRADDLPSAWGVVRALCGVGENPTLPPVHISATAWFMLIAGSLLAWAAPTSQSIVRTQPRWALVFVPILTLLAFAQLFEQGHVPFLYFRF